MTFNRRPTMSTAPTQPTTVQTTQSADGTTIAFEAYGTGPVVAIVGGAFCDRGAFRDVAQTLGELGFTGVTYDRRGRGDSSDTTPYAVAREVEDITLVIEAAAGGAPLTKAAAMEVPYRTAAWPPPPADYIERLEAYEAAGDREGILRFFN